MIEFYTYPTPNTWKVGIMLEECELFYTVRQVDITKSQQFEPDFLAISPNNPVPAIIDHDAPGEPRSVFESGAILLHLAERTGRFPAAEGPARTAALEWLFWQAGGLGPMAGQALHFLRDAPRRTVTPPTAMSWSAASLRRARPAAGERHLAGGAGLRRRRYGELGLGLYHAMQGQSLEDFPAVDAMSQRPAVQAAWLIGTEGFGPDRREALTRWAYTGDPRAGAAVSRVS